MKFFRGSSNWGGCARWSHHETLWFFFFRNWWCGWLMRTSGPGASSKSTRGRTREMYPCYGSIRVLLIYFILLYVFCWRETHVCEGISVFSSCLGGNFVIICSLGLFWGLSHETGGIFVKFIIWCSCLGRGTLFIKPTTNLQCYAIRFEILATTGSSPSSLCSHDGDLKPWNGIGTHLV